MKQVTTLHTAPKMPRGHVIIMEDGEVVANGGLQLLVRTACASAERVDIYLHPVDASEFMAWRSRQANADGRRVH
ncbi:MAG: hypothetical protein JWO56_1985 [Acidobacteria bacterium]|nr:hypothetical protein [Acidobacteriota bacterium]